MRVWVTRARPGAEATAERLTAQGHEPIVAPFLEVRSLKAPVGLEGAGALAFTSVAGPRAFPGGLGRDLPVFAVGDATAGAARAAGFADVRSAHGDVQALARLIVAERDAFTGPVLHAGARELAGDLAGTLKAAGIAARTVAIYETVAVTAPRAPQADAVLVHSPRAAALLADSGAAKDLPVLCLSPAVAAPLVAAGYRRVQAAATPDDATLLLLLEDLGRPLKPVLSRGFWIALGFGVLCVAGAAVVASR